MKKLLLLLTILIPSVAFAQALPIRNDTPTTLRDLGANLNVGRNFAVDQYGYQKMMCSDPSSGLSQSVIPVSNASSLNGVGSGAIGWSFVVADTAETSSTTTVINATTHSARVGDVIMFTAGTAGNIKAWSPVASVTTNTITISNALPTTPANGDTFYIMRPQPVLAPINDDVIGTFSNGWLTMFVRNELANPYAGSNGDATVPAATRAGALYVEQSTLHNDANPGKLAVADEDTAFAASDAVVKVGAVNNRSVTAYNTTNGDVTPIGVNDYGGVFCDLDPRYSGNTIAPNQREDTAFADQNGVMIAGGQSLSAIAQSVGASGDVAPIAMDLGNRLVVTGAPAGETWQICAAAVTDTTQRTIKSSVVSNRIYVTDITCTNEANVSSVLSFRDGSTEVWRGRVASTTLEGIGYFMYNFEIPLRLTSATAFTFAALTTGTNTTCCAGGYISTI